MKPSELPAIESLAEALNRHQVKWVLIGGMAVMLHGGGLMTSDCDLAYEKSRENLHRLAAALGDLGARPIRASETGDFQLDLSTLLAPFMHLKTEAGPVDLISRLPNIESFDELYSRSFSVEVDGVEVRIASINDLIRLKTGTNRERDSVHVEMLKTIQQESDSRGPK